MRKGPLSTIVNILGDAFGGRSAGFGVGQGQGGSKQDAVNSLQNASARS